jgi:hypothetical protein
MNLEVFIFVPIRTTRLVDAIAVSVPTIKEAVALGIIGQMHLTNNERIRLLSLANHQPPP